MNYQLFEIINLLRSQDPESQNLGIKLLKEHKNEFGKKAKYYTEKDDKYMPIRSFPFTKVLEIFKGVYSDNSISGRFKNLKIWTINLDKLEDAIHYQERMEENASK